MSENEDLFFGFDIGFGDVKAVVGRNSGGMATLKFPTAIAYSKEGIIGELAQDEGEIEFNGRKYLVGDAAVRCKDSFSTRNIEFLLTYAPLLVYKALQDVAGLDSDSLPGLLGAKKCLCIGIPLGYYHKGHALQARLTRYTVSSEIIQFDSVEVRAQGQGIFFDYVLDEKGTPLQDRINQDVLVVDIGFNTVDVLGVVDGRPSREWSDMIENGGICRVCEELRAYLKREFNFNLTEQAVKDVLQKGQISVYGDRKDLSTPIRKIKEGYSDWLVQEIKSRWEDFLMRAHKLIVAGGGAYYVEDFQKAYPDNFILIPEKPEYANARGFYKFLQA